ncbi:MAG: hypothetical protein ACXWYB_05800 [Aeromicrobium sp.]
MVDLFRIRAGVEALCAELVGAVECRNMPSLEGSTSTAAWLSNLALDDLKRIANHLLEVIDPDGAEEHMGK